MAPQKINTSFNELQQNFYSQNCDLQKCGSLLSKLKIALIEAGILLPASDRSLEDLVIVRDILEIGAFWSIRTKDIPSFDRYFSQLQTFYNDFDSALPPSPRKYPIIGLNLIRLLTQNRIAEFHTMLESLRMPTDELFENPYVKHPVNVERWLMEGSYSKVWNAREEAPAEEYKFFVDSLMGTIRNEIASCEEAAYDSLPLKDAATLLFFTNRAELLSFVQQRGWHIDLVTEVITFHTKGEEKLTIPKAKLITQSLAYARELERIV